MRRESRPAPAVLQAAAATQIEGMTIAPEDPQRDDVRALLERHLAFARRHSPPEDRHALGVGELRDPTVSFFSCRVNGELLAVGAMKRLDDVHAEIKSMHTAEPARGRGIGRAMLSHLVTAARQAGCTRLSLETGTMNAFAPARGLYASAGFVECDPFGSYSPSRHSVFMTLALASPGDGLSSYAADPAGRTTTQT